MEKVLESVGDHNAMDVEGKNIQSPLASMQEPLWGVQVSQECIHPEQSSHALCITSV